MLSWALLSGLAFALVQLTPARLVPLRPLLVAAGVAVVVRLLPLVGIAGQTGLLSVDTANFRAAAQAVIDGRDPLNPLSHPYPPLHMYIFAGAARLADHAPMTFFQAERLPLLAAAIAGTVLVFDAVRRLHEDERLAFLAAASFALCPLELLTSMYHGQFDIVGAVLAFAAWYAVRFYPERQEAAAVGGLLLGLAVMEKLWPLALAPALLLALPSAGQRARFAAGTALPVVALFAVYALLFGEGPRHVADVIRGYPGFFPNQAGHTLIVDRFGGFLPFQERYLAWANDHEFILVGGAVVVAWVVGWMRGAVDDAVAIIIVAMLAASTQAAPYHYLWLLPFALVVGPRWLVLLTYGFAASWVAHIMFPGAALYRDPPFHLPRAVDDRVWMLPAAVWVCLVIWFGVLAGLAPVRRRAAPRSQPEPAKSAGRSGPVA
jgi:hypothetical protein